jgi:hypothetical protein
MSLMSMLNQAQGGGLYASVAQSLGLDAAEARDAMAALCPAIAARLHDKAAQDEATYETLLDLLEDNGGDASLDDAEALTGSEAVSDGNAMLDEIYGTRNAAITAMRELAPGISEVQLPKLAAVSATAVLIALAQNQAPAPLAGAQPAASSGGGGLLGTIVEAVVKGMVQGAARSLAPKRRRRRRSYSSYWGPRRKRRTTRRRPRRTPLEEIFGSILGTRR